MKLKEWKNEEHAFFETDEAKQTAKVVLRFDRPEDLFDPIVASGTPLLRQEALASLQNVFGLVPPKYKVDLTLRFDDYGSYSEEELRDIVVKNFALELKSQEAATQRRSKLAYGFLAAGILNFLLMFTIRYVCPTETIWRELFFYLFDIVTTVSLYEAVTILSLERKGKRAIVKRMHDHFSGLHFEKSSK